MQILQQATRENKEVLEQLRDRVIQLHSSILDPIYKGRNMILPPALEDNIVKFSESVTLYSDFNCPSDMCY